jgi:hypothetical protein
MHVWRIRDWVYVQVQGWSFCSIQPGDDGKVLVTGISCPHNRKITNDSTAYRSLDNALEQLARIEKEKRKP